MVKKIKDRALNLFYNHQRKFFLIEVCIFLLILSPVIFLVYKDYSDANEHLTELTFSQRESLAHLAAITLEERFDFLKDLGVSFATRVTFRKLIEEGKWEEAIKILEDTPKNFPYIKQVFITDPSGVSMAGTPPAPEVIGKNFSFRDWYKTVIKTQNPYISEVYKRTTKPQYNIIAVAIPIVDDDQNLLGILLLQVTIDTILEWSTQIEVGPSGFVYFVDKNGNVAGHPKFSSLDEIVNFSQVPVVQKVLQGEKGIGIFYNPIEKEERLSAYEPIPQYGWGVIVQEPILTAFASRNEDLNRHLATGIITLLILFFSVYLISRFINSINSYRQKQTVFLESVGDGLAAIDRSWNITLWNKAASALSGWSREEALGKPFREILKFAYESSRKENIRFIEEAMLLGKTHFMEDATVLIGKDGKEIPMADSASPIFDQSGTVAGAVIIFRDISKERELEKAREEFSSLATHQLRTPVTVIKGYVEMLLEKSRIKEDKDMLEKIYYASQNLNDLANALLNVSRIELGTLAVNPEPAYLPDIASAVSQELSPEAEKKDIKIETNYAAGLPAINVDIKLIQAIFRNLLSNAIKYTPKKGKVAISITKEASILLIKVSDTGYGIPKDQQAKVFSKFFRGSNIREKEPEGTGLGLYIVKSIIEQTGGRVWFESEENKGTIFYVTIPLAGMKAKEGIKGLT